MASTMIDEPLALVSFLDKVVKLPRSPPALYMDLEGISLSRDGSICIIQVYLPTESHAYLIDICGLDSAAFSTPCSTHETLKSVLEDATIPKVFFDVRNDSDALHAHFRVKLAGVQDLQVMEVATRPLNRRRNVNGLARCIKHDAELSAPEKFRWNAVKDKGVKLFAPEEGGSYEVFRVRPLHEDIQLYCVQDVTLLPTLYNRYRATLSSDQWAEVLAFSENRAVFARFPDYEPNSRQKVFSPWWPESNDYQLRAAAAKLKSDAAATPSKDATALPKEAGSVTESSLDALAARTSRISVTDKNLAEPDS
ncbi:hypothetical protein FH972_023054 [Carpinus fangiana]|uniref:3'-5' exonuclease domain-containing protein n=1 Tax=Carpinus fangiana TaxID=176857 RepID=A0A5N6KUC6_9ROSI|nr:hypothetical protein FH972_023054 [Carpinus fangiana]